jgi:hypothetical protein
MMSELKLCPNLGCNNTGCIPVQISEDDWEPEQCEFCYTEPDSVFNALAAARLEGERVGVVKALDAVIANGTENRDIFNADLFIGMVYNMKSDYLKELK